MEDKGEREFCVILRGHSPRWLFLLSKEREPTIENSQQLQTTSSSLSMGNSEILSTGTVIPRAQVSPITARFTIRKAVLSRVETAVSHRLYSPSSRCDEITAQGAIKQPDIALYRCSRSPLSPVRRRTH
ncbi:hypothetical protein K0M31_003401 [Melipona bicolor]|uniref:Uncharacterized protein n=1 Tax=Melipona bicolor TaxID=60889 RepID=A0AA40FYW2_9HYME|nr:hypothetical protein K0M31_003401 [Melipona bicolor]